MDPEEDIWFGSELLLLDAGLRNFVASCFLLLNPEEIKACRLVCKDWNEFIMDVMEVKEWEGEAGPKAGPKVVSEP